MNSKDSNEVSIYDNNKNRNQDPFKKSKKTMNTGQREEYLMINDSELLSNQELESSLRMRKDYREVQKRLEEIRREKR